MSAPLTKADLALLGRVFAAEVKGALNHSRLYLFPTRSKRAPSLVERGYLAREKLELRDQFGEYTIEGYVLTERGRMAYCMSCGDGHGKDRES